MLQLRGTVPSKNETGSTSGPEPVGADEVRRELVSVAVGCLSLGIKAIAQVLVSRPLSVCGEVAERLKAAVC